MNTQTQEKVDNLFSEIKQSVVAGLNKNNFHSDIDYEINMISRCEYRGQIIGMKQHCKQAITLIIKQILKHE